MLSSEKHRNHRFFFFLTALAAFSILVRILFLVCADPNRDMVVYQDPVVSLRVARGTITDRNGRIIAIETPYYGCAFMLREMTDPEKTALAVASPLGMTPEEILAKTVGRTNYVLIKRRLSADEYETLRDIIQKKDLEGVALEKRYGRTYPQQFHAAQMIGFTNTDNLGIEGVELAYENELSPYPALTSDTTFGNDIQLTLDMDLQYLLDTQAVAIDRQHHGDYVLGIIMGAKTGEILAATTFPWYDPNLYGQSSADLRQNRIITYMYEPGSVFKIFSLAAELAAGQANFSEPFECDGSYTFTMPGGEKTTIKCVSAHGTVTPSDMISKSCNGAVANWALQTDNQLFHDFLASMGFGTALDIGLKGSITGLFPSIDTWSGRTKATLAFGQEIGVNALQMVTAATLFANDGCVLKPSIIRSIVDHEGNVLQAPGESQKTQVIPPQIAQDILSYMVEATEKGGTAIHTAVKGLQVGSKTGTAQILDTESNTYTEGTFLASTITVVPADNPQYIIYMAVANPKGSTIFGSNITAPAIRLIIEDMIRQGKLTTSIMATLSW